MNKLAEFLLGSQPQVNYGDINSPQYEELANQVDYLKNNLAGLSPKSQETFNKLGYDKVRENALNGNTSGISELATAMDNMGISPQINMGLRATPGQQGLLDRFIQGARENYNTSFAPSNLMANNNGLGYKLGEGFGSAMKLIDSPLGRGLMSAGLVKLAGGNKDTMIREGLAGAVGRQHAKTQDQVYRNQLKQYGYTDDDLANISGNITNDIYKNLATNLYKNRKLDQDSYIKMKYQYDKMLQNGMLSPVEYQQIISNLNNKYIEDNIVTVNSGNVQKSNQTLDTASKDQFRKDMIKNGIVRNDIGYGNLGLGYANLNEKKNTNAVNNAYKQMLIEQNKLINEILEDMKNNGGTVGTPSGTTITTKPADNKGTNKGGKTKNGTKYNVKN